MRAALSLSIGLAGLMMSCTAVVSLRPLGEEGSCAKGPPIEGEWYSPTLNVDGEDEPVSVQWNVTEQPNSYDVESREVAEKEPDDLDMVRLDVCLVTLKGQLFFDAEFREVVKGGTTEIDFDAFPAAAVPVHTIGKILFEPDMLVVQLLDFDWVQKNASETSWEYLTPDKFTDVALFTGPSAELREFMTRHVETPAAFGREFYLCRPKTDCVASAYEYRVREALSTHAAAEERLNLLEHLSKHYLRAGNFQRSLELIHRAVDLEPNDAAPRNNLGTVLLMNRDYETARNEFAALLDMQPHHLEAREGIGWSYFLEGKFEEAVAALRPVTESTNRSSVEPVLLAYIALKRIGRGMEAEGLLAKELETSRGTFDQQLLLLRFARRIEHYPFWLFEKEDDKNQARFFNAELLLANGNAGAARIELDACVTQGGNDSLYAAAAKIELEHMSALDFPPKVGGAGR